MRQATFNILHGRSPADGRVDLTRPADAVRTLDADVMALQEVDRRQERSQQADLTVVAADAMGSGVAPVRGGAVRDPWRDLDGRDGCGVAGQGRLGIALLSRYPATSWQVQRLPRIPCGSRSGCPARER